MINMATTDPHILLDILEVIHPIINFYDLINKQSKIGWIGYTSDTMAYLGTGVNTIT
jgi:hypothetical protein